MQDIDGVTFDGNDDLAVVSPWSGSTPCLIHPNDCTTGGSLLAWIKPSASCNSWGGIFGSQGNSGTTDTDGLVVACDGGSGTGIKYVCYLVITNSENALDLLKSLE